MSITQRDSIAGGDNGSVPWHHALQSTAATLLGLPDPWGTLADGSSDGGSNGSGGGGGGGSRNFIIDVLSQLGPLGQREALRSVACMLAIESNLAASAHPEDHVGIGDERITGGRGNNSEKQPLGHNSGGLDGEMKRNKDGACWGSRLASLMDASSQLLSSLKDAASRTSPQSGQSSGTELLTVIAATVPAAHACLVALLQVIPSVRSGSLRTKRGR